MSEVVIAGIGQTPVGEHWETSLRTLSSRAIHAAIEDAGGLVPDVVYIGNFLALNISHQANLGSLINDNAGLHHIEGVTVEAAEASGAAAFRLGYMAVRSGYVDVALVLGVEKFTDAIGAQVDTALSYAADYDYETVEGMTPNAQAALVAQRYFYEYRPPQFALAGFPLTAHAKGANNTNAMYRKAIRREVYEKAEAAFEPLNQFDVAPYADGAAAVILTRPELVPASVAHKLVRVTGSSNVTDTLALHDRADLLAFDAAGLSVERACRQAGILPQDVDLFEVCDSTSIYAALSLEAAGLAARGQGWKYPEEGKIPILTMGGLKARGNPLGATGVYQLVEAALQLRGEAGANQVPNAHRALVQTLGGPASTAVTHVLESS
jgi:acetyl-CoA C-acetyltransferase